MVGYRAERTCPDAARLGHEAGTLNGLTARRGRPAERRRIKRSGVRSRPGAPRQRETPRIARPDQTGDPRRPGPAGLAGDSVNLEAVMDQRKNDRPRRRLRWLGLPESLRDRLLARMLAEAREDERRGRVPPSDLTSARL